MILWADAARWTCNLRRPVTPKDSQARLRALTCSPGVDDMPVASYVSTAGDIIVAANNPVRALFGLPAGVRVTPRFPRSTPTRQKVSLWDPSSHGKHWKHLTARS